MKKILLLLLSLLGDASAQIIAPGVKITVTPGQPLKYEVAQKILVQPNRLETRLPSGYTVGTLVITLFSEVNAEVLLKFSDPRLAMRGSTDSPLSLAAYSPQSVTLIANGAHSGTITISNTEGKVLAQVPYTVAPTKTVNQSVSLNYSPTTDWGSATYSISGVPQSILDPRWNINFNVNVRPNTGKVGGSVGISINW
ncbi:hypothetical protein E5F05_18450 [Deinococcus metallilatus]|uniref:DUF4402 domain-containing protein n=1 Tax=Deinococcus metallilatus TaxID=1211322 RepID=A0AAJ5F175_9DEIO|nr:hypothetical protein [Deinococcus metallilatus]MBB5296213.1 hypothetical protein [Deinococcus metallilatus]QBY09740.1 hypothetical protein E5F05_18450 [Deinococcus metallilatus]RXJ08938.1 hypothetical protein ERJ73_17285 [Deinococcus metallilatus]TLK23683.1 hypothetical protein FCS05_15795 [Deinococcus metallilatus]